MAPIETVGKEPRHKIRGLQSGDLEYLAANLRSSDVLEAFFASGSTNTLHSLQRSVDASQIVQVGCGDGVHPSIIWGTVLYSRTSALIWAMGTPDIVNYKRVFVKESKEHLQQIFEDNPEVNTLFNFTYGDNHLHHLWLKHCGAQFLPAVPYGIYSKPFLPFFIMRSTNV